MSTVTNQIAVFAIDSEYISTKKIKFEFKIGAHN